MGDSTLDFLAWGVIAFFYIFGAIPCVGGFLDEFGGYLKHLKIGLVIHCVLAAFAGIMWALLWALFRVST